MKRFIDPSFLSHICFLINCYGVYECFESKKVYPPNPRLSMYGKATNVPIMLPTFANATTISSLITRLFQKSRRLSSLLRF